MAEIVSPDKWIPDKDASECMTCGKIFSYARRKHHCRLCGHVVCGKCSQNRMKEPRLTSEKKIRVCDGCFDKFAPSYLVKPSKQVSGQATSLNREFSYPKNEGSYQSFDSGPEPLDSHIETIPSVHQSRSSGQYHVRSSLLEDDEAPKAKAHIQPGSNGEDDGCCCHCRGCQVS